MRPKGANSSLREHYAGLDSVALERAFLLGPSAHAKAETWEIIDAECRRRSLALELPAAVRENLARRASENVETLMRTEAERTKNAVLGLTRQEWWGVIKGASLGYIVAIIGKSLGLWDLAKANIAVLALAVLLFLIWRKHKAGRDDV